MEKPQLVKILLDCNTSMESIHERKKEIYRFIEWQHSMNICDHEEQTRELQDLEAIFSHYVRIQCSVGHLLEIKTQQRANLN